MWSTLHPSSTHAKSIRSPEYKSCHQWLQFPPFEPDCKYITRSAVYSCHRASLGIVGDPLKPLKPSEQYRIGGFREGPSIGPTLCRETRVYRSFSNVALEGIAGPSSANVSMIIPSILNLINCQLFHTTFRF